MLSCCCCFNILISLYGNIIGHSPIIFLKYFIRLLYCNWLFLMFRFIKGLFYSYVDQRIPQNISKTFIQRFVNVIFNISYQICSDVSQMFYRMCS